MKINKILIFLLTICILTSAFAFSVSAEENVTDLTGTTWVFKGNTISRLYPGMSVNCTIIENIGTSNSSKIWVADDDDQIFRWIKADTGGGTGAVVSNIISITFDGGQDVTNPTLISWVLENMDMVVSVCDGSSCPATDVNMDNICDDCGMVFSVLRDYTPSDFPSGYPSVPSLEMPNARYYLYRVYSSNTTYLVVYPSTVTPTYDTTQQNGLLTFSESYGTFSLDTTNNEWVLSSSDSPYIIGGTNNNSVDILYSSVQIKDENGENFFPIPLWETIQGVTQGELTQTTLPTTVGTMKTLVVCGVGLMACLVALSLFGKVLGRYRKK